RELRILAVEVKGRRGSALARIESLAPVDVRTGSEPRWREQSLEFEKTKRGWVMSPIRDAGYIKREVALQVVSARLAELKKNTKATPKQKNKQRKIIRLLNSLLVDDPGTASAQSN